jgi:hypothetical protein
VTLEVTEHDCSAIALRQSAELLVESRREIGRNSFRTGPIRGYPQHAGAALVPPATRHVGPGVGSNPQSDTVQPASDGFLPPHGSGAPDEDQEGRLKGIFGVVLVA